MTEGPNSGSEASVKLIAALRSAARQEQFLEVVSAEEARRRFESAINMAPLAPETVPLTAALGRVLATDLIAPIDTPPFDRSVVDGFAVRAVDTQGASERTPKRLTLNNEVIACGHPPALQVETGTATTISTGGPVPRGSDAIVMVEWTDLAETPEGLAIDIRRPVTPGQFIAYAGSDIARGETLLRRGVVVASREIGVLAACGFAQAAVVKRPKVAVISTGDELTEAGQPLRPGAVYDSNGAIIAAAVSECGGEPVAFGAIPDNEHALEKAVRSAVEQCDIVVLSGGTSKGAGDLSYQVISKLGKPGVLVHGVALKPGKPLCLAVVHNKPIAVLPGFPTSAIFTFHSFVAPVIRAFAGLRPEAETIINTKVPVRISSELGRQEFVLVSLVEGDSGLIAFPTGKGSGAVTAFSQADGFLAIDALATSLEAEAMAKVTLIGNAIRPPDLVVMGSHCIALDAVLSRIAEDGFLSRTISIGSMGGVAAAERGECDIAPVHLLDPANNTYNSHLIRPGLALMPGWRRMQGIVFRSGDQRFTGKSADQALKAALSDRDCLMVNRNAGSGTRILIDRLLNGVRPAGYANQPKSHNAVAAAVLQKRADWGVSIESVARIYGLEFLPIAPEHYDFLLVEKRRERPAVQAFLSALTDASVRERIRSLRMLPAGSEK